MFGVLGAVTPRIPLPKVKSKYVLVSLSSWIINYKKLRKRPSQILKKKVSRQLTFAHWQRTFLAYGKGRKVEESS